MVWVRGEIGIPARRVKALNLVHPSLFPLVYGRAQVLRSGRVGLLDCLDNFGKGDIAPEQSIEEEQFGQFDGDDEASYLQLRENERQYSLRFH